MTSVEVAQLELKREDLWSQYDGWSLAAKNTPSIAQMNYAQQTAKQIYREIGEITNTLFSLID